MKRIVDIPNELTKKGRWYTDEELWALVRAVQNGTPIPDNATNGDVLWTMFPTMNMDETIHKIYATIQYDVTYVGIEFDAMKEWWNAPYQKGGKK